MYISDDHDKLRMVQETLMFNWLWALLYVWWCWFM